MTRLAPIALWEAVCARLRDAILSGELKAGARITETELAERFGTSRGPVREAIRELAREGLLVELPRKGTLVSSLTAHDLTEVYGVREALETAASRTAIARASKESLLALEGHLIALERAGDYLEQAVHDLAFHRSLVALAGNARMTNAYEAMLTQTMLLLRVAAGESSALRADLKPAAHREILSALLARDEELARTAIDAHYRYAEDRLFPS